VRYTCAENWGIEQEKDRLTDDGFPILLNFERAFAVPDQKGEVEQVLDGLRKVVWIGNESEKVHGAILLHEQIANLERMLYRFVLKRGPFS
jgi:hypothetical protein